MECLWIKVLLLLFRIFAIEENEIHESSFCARGSGVSPVKSTFALRWDAGATIGAQMLSMSQVFLPIQCSR
jgi:hypothetical protein